MGIRLKYDPVAAPLVAAYATGVGAAQERRRKEAMDLMKERQRMQFQAGLQFQHQKFMAGQSQLERDWRTGESETERTFRAGESKLEREERERLWQLGKDERDQIAKMEEVRAGVGRGDLYYTPDQSQQLADLAAQASETAVDPKLTQEQRQQALRQIRDKQNAIKLNPQETPLDQRPKKMQDIIDERVQERDGQYWTIDDTGTPQIARGAVPRWEREQREKEFSQKQQEARSAAIFQSANELMKIMDETVSMVDGKQSSTITPRYKSFADAAAEAARAYDMIGQAAAPPVGAPPAGQPQGQPAQPWGGEREGREAVTGPPLPPAEQPPAEQAPPGQPPAPVIPFPTPEWGELPENLQPKNVYPEPGQPQAPQGPPGEEYGPPLPPGHPGSPGRTPRQDWEIRRKALNNWPKDSPLDRGQAELFLNDVPIVGQSGVKDLQPGSWFISPDGKLRRVPAK